MVKKRLFLGFLSLLFCTIGTFTIFTPTIISGFSEIQVSKKDTMLNAYFLEHGYKSFFDKEYKFNFWSPGFFYPEKEVLARSDTLIGAAPIYWMFRIFFTWDLAYQLWMITIFALTFFAGIYFFQFLGINSFYSLIGSFIWVYGMHRIGNLSHIQLHFQLYTPLALVTLIKFLNKPNIGLLSLTVILVLLQQYTNAYSGLFLIIGMATFISINLATYKNVRDRFWKWIKSNNNFLKSMISIILLLSIYLFTNLPYLRLMLITGGRNFKMEVVPYIVEPIAWALAPRDSYWRMHNIFNISLGTEKQLFGGFSLIFLVGTTIFYLLKSAKNSDEINTLVLPLFITFFATIVFATKPTGYFFWLVIYKIIPGVSALRAIGRIRFIGYLFGISAGMISLQNIKIGKNPIFIIILALIVISENYVPNKTKHNKQEYIQNIEKLSNIYKENQCKIGYLSLQNGTHPGISQVRSMWAGLLSNTPVLNGYSGWNDKYYGVTLSREDISNKLKTKNISIEGTCVVDTNEFGEYYLKDKL